MKRLLNNLIGFTIHGSDGELGKVKDFYFDDKSWIIRYLIVETGSWLNSRKVLLAPQAVLETDWEKESFRVHLSAEKIKNSPPIDTDKPVSRQQEMELYAYYPWGGFYWTGVGIGGMGMSYPISMSQVEIEEPVLPADKNGSDNDPHLRSADAVKGYTIKAIDGDVGEVENFLLDDSNWKLAYLVVDTGNWFPGKKVVLSPNWIQSIKWETSEVTVRASVEQVKNSPEYDAANYLSDDYESNLQNYYGRFISHNRKP